MTTNTTTIAPVAGWIFGAIVFTIGIMNLFFVHAVPGNVFLLLSFIYFPPVSKYLQEQFRLSIPGFVKIILGIAILWFTLGVSDLGDMIDGNSF